VELTILMPCLNEAETLAICIDKAKQFLSEHQITGEVLIADNGSEDGSQAIATAHGARVIAVEQRGYGAALIAGVNAAEGRYIIMGDADDSYDFTRLEHFVEKLRDGFELVMGNRFKGGIAHGAMPMLHKYLGNPVLSGIGRLFFKSPIKDFHCGLRGFAKDAIQRLDLHTPGMEFASEMVVKSILQNLKITEVPTTLSPDGRSRPPHLRSWRDGWRHLRFLLIFSPNWLFLYPGLALLLFGLIGMLTLMTGPVTIGSFTFAIHTLLFMGIFILVGLQAVFFALFAKYFSINLKLMPASQTINKLLKIFTLERSLIVGGLLIILGIIGSLHAFFVWGNAAFGSLNPTASMRSLIPALISLAAGGQIIFSSFFLSILSLAKNPR